MGESLAHEGLLCKYLIRPNWKSSVSLNTNSYEKNAVYHRQKTPDCLHKHMVSYGNGSRYLGNTAQLPKKTTPFFKRTKSHNGINQTQCAEARKCLASVEP